MVAVRRAGTALLPLIVAAYLAEPASGQMCTPDAAYQIAATTGTLDSGQTFEFPFGRRFALRLTPIAYGWAIEMGETGRDENLARLTPPWHFVPNPRYLEGWHFRNAANTGANDGSVNAPQDVRTFIFSPEVGRSLEYSGSATPPDVPEAVARFGRGWLVLRDYELTPAAEGARAAFVRIDFEVCVRWLRSG